MGHGPAAPIRIDGMQRPWSTTGDSSSPLAVSLVQTLGSGRRAAGGWPASRRRLTVCPCCGWEAGVQARRYPRIVWLERGRAWAGVSISIAQPRPSLIPRLYAACTCHT